MMFKEAVRLQNLYPVLKRSMTSPSKWILKTSETRSLTRTATLGVVADVADLVKYVVQCLEDQTCKALSLRGIDPGMLEEIFSGPITKPFEGLTSFKCQLQYYRKHFSLIVSQLIPLLVNI